MFAEPLNILTRTGIIKLGYFFYILKSKKTSKYYIGQTTNIRRRLLQNNNGKSKSTKSGIPWELVYSEDYATRSESMQRERYIKSQKSRIFIEELIS